MERAEKSVLLGTPLSEDSVSTVIEPTRLKGFHYCTNIIECVPSFPVKVLSTPKVCIDRSKTLHDFGKLSNCPPNP